MLRRIAILLSVFSCVLAGTATAQEKPGFLFVTATVTDVQKLGAYGRALPPIYDQYGGTYVVSGGVGRNIESLEGDAGFQSVIFARFGSLAEVEDFWWSDEYRAVVHLRDGAGQFDVVGLQGTGQTPYASVDGVPPAYQISLITVKDASKLPPYYAAMKDLMAESPARLIAVARPDDLTVLEGSKPTHVIEIASWPSMAALKAFLADPRYIAAMELRAEATVNVLLAAEPVRPPG